ncbi:HAD family phosphatase [Streptomyces sp. NEAU-YJ-81]|uniref:HAD family hydrolase n=1 Tax=Streptomyces sp. NEAU-YJ-81 TaxID=2820288 RepID=UPI001ABC8E48|nr:HAD hydrolase-like protein [Streptomyces sp. NEAU-YJ-81]MBO3682309.1 HAD hydrolase-like protein [Streptomyces sp. NEAU-YJ-81]
MNTRPRSALSDTRLVIFDCDGVLVDTERIGPAVGADMAAEVGWPLTPGQVRHRFLGRPESYLYEQVRAHATAPVGPNWLDAYRKKVRDAFAAQPHTMPGVQELLDFLDHRRLPYCVASSGSHERIQHSLTSTGLLGRFAGHVFSADDVARGKPCGCRKSVSPLCDLRVFVDEAAEPIASMDASVVGGGGWLGFGE